MLLRIERFSDLDPRKLMDIYEEGNLENTDYFYPELKDKTEAVKKVEEGFLAYLERDFFHSPGASYWILEESGQWVSALRMNELKPRFYYLEALETRPDSRKKGYAAELINEMLDELKKHGPFTICDCVGKQNAASIRAHLKCGFSVISEDGYDYLCESADSRVYGMGYQFG